MRTKQANTLEDGLNKLVELSTALEIHLKQMLIDLNGEGWEFKWLKSGAQIVLQPLNDTIYYKDVLRKIPYRELEDYFVTDEDKPRLIYWNSMDEYHVEFTLRNNISKSPAPKTKKMTFTTAIDVLKSCMVEDSNVKLPNSKLSKELYDEVKAALNKIGGIWKGGKVQAFEFEEDPTQLLAELQSGKTRNIQKELQAFFTHDRLADEVVELAQIKDGMTCLEPSAGRGAILNAIYKAFPRVMQDANDKPCVTVDFYELSELNKNKLIAGLSKENLSRTSFMGEDFLAKKHDIKYDRIIANPPFSKNQDIDHIREMYSVCKNGGKIVSIASIGWQVRTNKKETAFREWLKEIKSEVIPIAAGEFKESGTTVATCIIIINK